MNKQTKLGLKAIGASLILSLPLISLVATAEPTANLKQNANKKTCITDAYPSSEAPSGTSQTNPPTSATAPARVAGPPVNITLVNLTNANICFQALKYTGTRNLSGLTQVTLKSLPTPVTLTFYRVDGGLTQVSINRQRQSITVVFNPTTDLGQDRQAMTVDENGRISTN